MSVQTAEVRLTWGVEIDGKVTWFDIENNAFYNAKALDKPVLRRVETRIIMGVEDIAVQDAYGDYDLPYASRDAMLAATGSWVSA